MTGTETKVTISKKMSEHIRRLDDDAFDTVLELIDHLAEDLDDFSREHETALSAITRVHPYAFVCVRKTPTSKHWVVVEIFEDGDPDGLPPGGGRLAGRWVAPVGTVFPALPESLRQLFANAKELEDEPVRPNRQTWILILPGTNVVSSLELTGHRYVDAAIEFGIRQDNSSDELQINYEITFVRIEKLLTGQNFRSAGIRICDPTVGATADITPELSLMPPSIKIMLDGILPHDHQ